MNGKAAKKVRRLAKAIGKTDKLAKQQWNQIPKPLRESVHQLMARQIIVMSAKKKAASIASSKAAAARASSPGSQTPGSGPAMLPAGPNFTARTR